MNPYLLKLTPIALLVLVISLASPALFDAFQKDHEDAGDIILGNVENLLVAYDRWKAEASRNGIERRLELSLHYSKGLSTEFTTAHGHATLDLGDGSFHVEVSGLPAEEVYDVWLIDNHPGGSLRPEAEDRTIRIGSLDQKQDTATLTTQLEPGALEDFQLDLIVIAPEGEHPAESVLLVGSPSLFQRVHFSEQRSAVPILAEVQASAGSDREQQSFWSAPFGFLVPAPAYAHERNRGKADGLRSLVARGEDLFFNETFNGNGRTCGTCHPADNNFTIDPAFIATLPPDDPLFVAEFVDALEENFEKPELMRKVGLILENQDGFGDLTNNFNMRGVPHTLALPTSLRPAPDGADGTMTPPNERTGWSGDGAPGSGTLREFAIGAVTQHFPLTLGRDPEEDFRLPTDAELDALEAFQLSLGRQEDLDLSMLDLKGAVPRRGLEIFLATNTQGATVAAGKCQLCHANAGASVSFIPGGFNFNFDTGVEQLPDQPADLIDLDNNPPDGGFGTAPHPMIANAFGDGTFNTPTLVEAADTGPFFHNNAIETIEESVGFYNSTAFNESAAGQFLASMDGGIGIQLEATQVVAVAAFLRVINALENIRSSIELLERAADSRGHGVRRLLRLATAETEDAMEVLKGGGLHPDAVKRLEGARVLMKGVTKLRYLKRSLIRKAIEKEEAARARLIEASG